MCAVLKLEQRLQMMQYVRLNSSLLHRIDEDAITEEFDLFVGKQGGNKLETLKEIVRFTKKHPLALFMTQGYQHLTETIYLAIAAADSVS